MPLSPRRTRLLVAALLVVMLALAGLATFMIVNGWEDEGLQELVREAEEEEGR